MKFAGLLFTIALISETAASSLSLRSASKAAQAEETQEQIVRSLRLRCKLAYSNALEGQSTEDYVDADVRCSKEEMQRFHQKYKDQLKAALMKR